MQKSGEFEGLCRWVVLAVASLSAMVLSSLIVNGQELQNRCSKGMVWGGLKCEWPEVCPDPEWSPNLEGKCNEEWRKKAEHSPDVCPPGFLRVKGKCMPAVVPSRCPDGQAPINGQCIRPPRKCEERTLFKESWVPRRQSDRRTVDSSRVLLLVAGKADSLYERYVKDAKQRHVEIEPSTLAVIFYDQSGKVRRLKGGRQVKRNFGEILGGITWDQKWRMTLRGATAKDLPDPEKEARGLGADLICGQHDRT